MRLRELTEEDVIFDVDVEQDSTPLEGNVLASGDDTADEKAERDVQEAIDAGSIWAWAYITVTARWKSFHASDSLGCCSYDNEEQFKQCGYFTDMKKEALEKLNRKLQREFKSLLSLADGSSPAPEPVKEPPWRTNKELRDLWARYRGDGIIPMEENDKLDAMVKLTRRTAEALTHFPECASTEYWLWTQFDALRRMAEARKR